MDAMTRHNYVSRNSNLDHSTILFDEPFKPFHCASTRYIILKKTFIIQLTFFHGIQLSGWTKKSQQWKIKSLTRYTEHSTGFHETMRCLSIKTPSDDRSMQNRSVRFDIFSIASGRRSRICNCFLKVRSIDVPIPLRTSLSLLHR